MRRCRGRAPPWSGVDGNIGLEGHHEVPGRVMTGEQPRVRCCRLAFAGEGQHRTPAAKMLNLAADTVEATVSKSVARAAAARPTSAWFRSTLGRHRVTPACENACAVVDTISAATISEICRHPRGRMIFLRKMGNDGTTAFLPHTFLSFSAVPLSGSTVSEEQRSI